MKIIKLKQLLQKAALQEGFAMGYVLFIGLLITTLLFTIFGYVVISKRLEAKTIIKKKLDLACYSAVQIVLAEPLGENDFRRNLLFDSINVSIEKTRSGLFYEINAIAAIGKFSSKYMCRAGAVPDSLYSNGLILTNPNLNGVIADNVSITGDIVTATNRFTKARITGKNDGPAVIEGKFKTYNALNSKLYNENNVKEEFAKLKRQECDTVITGNFILDENNISSLQNKRIKVQGDLLIRGNLETKRYTNLNIRATGRAKITENSKINLGITVYADSGMTVGPNCIIENLICFTEGKTILERNSIFENCQLIGKNDFSVKEDLFKYPSLLCMYADEFQKKKDKTLSIEKSRINGYVLLVTPVTGIAANRSRIKIDNESRIKGFIYSENYVETGSGLDGCLCIFNLYYYKNPTEYINWLTDLKINRRNLEAGFLMPAGFYKNEKNEILFEKWIY